jgi:small subunit ribosomal protein S20
MANIKSAEKRIRQTAKRTARNRAARTELRSAVKRYRSAEKSARAAALPATYSEIDRALRKGIIHKNAAARYKSRLAKTAAAPAKKTAGKR